MIDQAKIYVKAGDGGSGCNSFRGAKFTRFRRSDGGNGGKGADVIIRAERNIQGLEHFQVKKHFRAENGKNGQANKKKGANRQPCIIKVPLGTIVRDVENNLILADLIEPGQDIVVAKAGEAGRGNRGKERATAGTVGEERHLYLELKLIADIGIVGYPNSGKSTLLTKISSARPKIASYPFTTVSCVLGVTEFSDFSEPTVLTAVEIPALIKGSHQGKGLGTQFLRHAERAKVLIHLLDMSGQEACVPLENYQSLNQELKIYAQRLRDKPQILVANKMDLANAEINLSKFSAQIKKEIHPISALHGTGIKELLDCVRNYFR